MLRSDHVVKLFHQWLSKGSINSLLLSQATYVIPDKLIKSLAYEKHFGFHVSPLVFWYMGM